MLDRVAEPPVSAQLSIAHGRVGAHTGDRHEPINLATWPRSNAGNEGTIRADCVSRRENSTQLLRLRVCWWYRHYDLAREAIIIQKPVHRDCSGGLHLI